MLVQAFELSYLEGQNGQQHDHHQQERVDPPLHQRLHLRLHTYKGKRVGGREEGALGERKRSNRVNTGTESSL